MPVPSTVKVLDEVYTVIVTEEHMNDKVGEIQYSASTIKLHPDQSDNRFKSTMMHEIVHSIFNKFYTFEHEDHDEKLVDNIATGVLTIMKDNPKLVEWLLEKD